MFVPGTSHSLTFGSMPFLAAGVTLALLTATTLGFLAGLWWAAGAERRALKRARKSFVELV